MSESKEGERLEGLKHSYEGEWETGTRCCRNCLVIARADGRGWETPDGKVFDEEPPCRVPEGGYVLRRHASGSWWIRYMQNGKMHDGSLGTADREEAKRRAKVLFCEPSSAEKPIWWLPPAGARVEAFEVGRTTNGVEVRREAETMTFITDLHRVAPRSVGVEPATEKPIWWINQRGERVAGFENRRVERLDAGFVSIRLENSTTFFLTAPHRVEPRELAQPDGVDWTNRTDEGRAEYAHLQTLVLPSSASGEAVADKIHAEAFTADEHLDTKLIRQGGGWSTFKRNGEWWAERIDGGRRASLCLSTADDAIAGQRFAALQNDFRDTPLDELLSATFALRAGWARTGSISTGAPMGQGWQMNVSPAKEGSALTHPHRRLLDQADERLRQRANKRLLEQTDEQLHGLAAPTEQERADDAGEVLAGLERYTVKS